MMKILLADDEPHVRNVMAFKLKGAGYAVVTATDGQDALELAQIERPDLIITDYQMPRMNGLELCRALPSQPATATTPVIMVTSRDFEIGPEQTAGTNIRRVLNKPFSPKEVVAVVKSVLEKTSP
jgi:CheY-like chemotaxis protein